MDQVHHEDLSKAREAMAKGHVTQGFVHRGSAHGLSQRKSFGHTLIKGLIRAEYGDSELLQIATLERPLPRENEVLIRVKAAGLDDGQWHLMTGRPGPGTMGLAPTSVVWSRPWVPR